MDNFYKRLSQAQAELKAPKNQFNNFGKYKYRSCEDILEAAKPVMVKHGLVLYLSDSVEEIGGRVYIKATAIIHDTETDAFIQNCAFAREPSEKKGMDDSQVTGTASSYARKYALNGLLCIDDTKDADTDEYAKAQQKPTAQQKAVAATACENCGAEVKAVNGKSVQVIASATKKKYGKVLCWDCALKAKGEENA